MCELSRYAWMSHSGCKFAEECERGGGDTGASWKTVPQCLSASSTHCSIVYMISVNIWKLYMLPLDEYYLWATCSLSCWSGAQTDVSFAAVFFNFMSVVSETQFLCLLVSTLISSWMSRGVAICGFPVAMRWRAGLFIVCWNVCNMN